MKVVKRLRVLDEQLVQSWKRVPCIPESYENATTVTTGCSKTELSSVVYSGNISVVPYCVFLHYLCSYCNWSMSFDPYSTSVWASAWLLTTATVAVVEQGVQTHSELHLRLVLQVQMSFRSEIFFFFFFFQGGSWGSNLHATWYLFKFFFKWRKHWTCF